jgi:hypothetical protein
MKKRKRYEKPRLKRLGSVFELTNAKRPGAADGRKSKILGGKR